MSWQKCPKCVGTGHDLSNPYNPSGCHICNGCGVINEQTGEPLYKTVTKTNIDLNDLRNISTTDISEDSL